MFAAATNQGTTPNPTLLLFPFVKPSDDATTQPTERTIRFRQGNTQHEIYMRILQSFETDKLLPHCLEFRTQMSRTTLAEANMGPQLFAQFPRTLVGFMTTVWDLLLTEFPPADQSVDAFDIMLRHFIAAHCDEEDRHDFVDQLRTVKKPRWMTIGDFRYQFLLRCSYVEWLPGNAAPLTDDEQKEYFFKGTPEAWQKDFKKSKTIGQETLTSIVYYMKKLEREANKAAARNTENQRQANRASKHKDNKRTRAGNEDTKRPAKKQQARIQNSDPCPLPNHNHTWGACRSNKYNDEALAARAAAKAKDNKSKKDQAHVIQELDKMHLTSDASDDESSVGCKYSCTNACYQASLTHCLSNAFTTEMLTETPTDFALSSSNVTTTESSNDCFDNELSSLVRPTTIVEVKEMQRTKVRIRPLKVLLDSGSDRTIITRSCLPKGVLSSKEAQPTSFTTINGIKKVTQSVQLSQLKLPEFSPSRTIDAKIKALVVDKDTCGTYDMIMGLDCLCLLGIDIRHSTKTVVWKGKTIAFHPRSLMQNDVHHIMAAISDDPLDDNQFDSSTDYLKRRHKTLLPSNYEEVNTDEIAQQQVHLDDEQRRDLANIFRKYTKLFSGKLGVYPKKKLHFELVEGATPVHSRPYSVPFHQRQVFKDELDRLVTIGVLEPCGASEWLAPTFIIPKKDNKVRWISDFRGLNKMIKRKVYTLPKIQDIIRRRFGYKFFTKLDLNMCFYTYALDDESSKLCTICTPHGNYRYKVAPMGVKQSPDFAQEIIEDVLRDIADDVEAYIDDIGCFSSTWQQHIELLDKVLTRLQDNNFTVNPTKCEWAVQETDFLGHWMTPTGIKPWKKKVEPILRLRPPTTPKELRSFIGAVSFYRDFYRRRSDILAPLTAQVNRKKLDWTSDCQRAFDTMKALLAKDAFLRYPDPNKPFHIYCDASDYQLGSVIMQEGIPVAYYSRKLNNAQRNYTTGEKELLSIVETFREYRDILLGCSDIHVYTDHKNITHHKLNTQRVLRWRLFLEEYGPRFHYIKGAQNLLADALSRLPLERQSPQSATVCTPDNSKTVHRAHDYTIANPQSHCFSSMVLDDPDLLDCFVHLPVQTGQPFVLDYETIADAQQRDASLQAALATKPNQFGLRRLTPDLDLICHTPTQGNWKVCLPNELLGPAVQWYHLALGHCGINRLYDTISQRFHNSLIKETCETLVNSCDTCQRYKSTRGYGHTAPREAGVAPWHEVAVDLIGPWELTIGDQTVSFMALTIIDTTTNLTELVRLQNKTSAHVALQFENTWLSRYPLPMHCIYDQGGEFIGFEFQRMLQRRNIKKHPTGVRSPQANAICERMHQVVGNALRVLATLHPPDGIEDANTLIDTALANAVYATRSTYHSGLKGTPGSIVFNRDMILDIPFIADLQMIQNHRQQLIDDRLITANNKRFSHDYNVGDQVLKLIPNPNKLDPRAEGPYVIERVHANGTLTIRLDAHLTERVSLRRVKPYHT